jgi:hypothetical protein
MASGSTLQKALNFSRSLPQFGDVAELLALRDFALLQVRVVVDHRQVGRHFVVQLAGDFGVEEEILVHECSHVLSLR